MHSSDYLTRFERILKRFDTAVRKFPATSFPGCFYYDSTDSQAWVSEAGAAIKSVFPPAHYFCQTWDRLATRMQPNHVRGITLDEMVGTFQAATYFLRDGQLGALINEIHAQTEIELLDQASTFVAENRLAAASVIAGGALETHLRQLVARYNLTIAGAGSINSYNGAIAQARKTGAMMDVTSGDVSQVTAWGQDRNDAAHDPGNYRRSKEQVDLMIQGIRNFISRTTQ